LNRKKEMENREVEQEEVEGNREIEQEEGDGEYGS
jgi:hypothetical protein